MILYNHVHENHIVDRVFSRNLEKEGEHVKYV